MKIFIPCSLLFLSFKSLFQTRYKANPIKKYKIVHAGPKTQLGGLKIGLLRCSYQAGIEGIVATLPRNATRKQRAIETINFRIFILTRLYTIPLLDIHIIAHT
jgi:hypothetical protein